MIKKFALRRKGTDLFLSTKSCGGRELAHVQDAQLWSKRHHAVLSHNYHSTKDAPLEIVEFGVLLVATKKGYVG